MLQHDINDSFTRGSTHGSVPYFLILPIYKNLVKNGDKGA